jgi:hypothetical protein
MTNDEDSTFTIRDSLKNVHIRYKSKLLVSYVKKKVYLVGGFIIMRMGSANLCKFEG